MLAQYACLWSGQSPAVEHAVAALPGPPASLAAQLGTYLRTNQPRLCYGRFRQRGLLCGSGPVEAAHRTLLQVRINFSG